MTGEKQWLFDRPWTKEFMQVRIEFVRDLIRDKRRELGLRSALDVGCGVGDSSKFLLEEGFDVVAVDGRRENVAEAGRRYPEAKFLTANAEDLPAGELGIFDLVLCFGLLYHLENPFRTIRSLSALTSKVLLVESMCAPGKEPSMQLLDEFRADDQGLDYIAFYPTEACLVKMLYRAGFPHVYDFSRLPNHELFRATASYRRRRTMLAASKLELRFATLKPVPEPKRPWDIWQTPWAAWRGRIGQKRRSAWEILARRVQLRDHSSKG